MKVIHINIRLSEGGAASVARGIHNDLIMRGEDSHFLYGYGPGLDSSPLEGVVKNSTRITSRATAFFNYVTHSLVGVDFFSTNTLIADKVQPLIESADVVHLHAIHSHMVNYDHLLNIISNSSCKLVWTLHDFWTATGRCAIVDKCIEWKKGCLECNYKSNYPRSFIDFSKISFDRKINRIKALGNRVSFVSPSTHLARRHDEIYPDNRAVVINNAVDKVFSYNEKIRSKKNLKVTLLVVANDLSDEQKTNRTFINRILASTNADLITVGKNSPFHGGNITNLGTVYDREELARIYNKADALIFTSLIDNYPMVLCEAQACGLPVLAVKSDAGHEILHQVNATCLEESEIIDVIQGGNFFGHYVNIKARAELAKLADVQFGFQRMISSYLELYGA